MSVALSTYGNRSNDITLAKQHRDSWIHFLEQCRNSYSSVEKNLEVGVGHFCAVRAIIELVSVFQVTMSYVGTHLYSMGKINSVDMAGYLIISSKID